MSAWRVARVALPLAAWLLLATHIRPTPPPPPPRPEAARLSFEPVMLHEGDPARRRAGALVFLQGWAISSDSPRFGGISALHIEDGRVLALSDTGSVLRFALPGRGPARASLVPLPRGPGPPTRKSNRDTEALAVRNNELLVAFEHRNAVWRYRLPDLETISSTRPAAIRSWRGNAGTEAMVRLPDGRYLLFSEGREGAETSDIALFAGDPSRSGTPTAALRYRRLPGYRITDAALLPDGRLLLLNRRFTLLEGASAILAVADTRAIRPGATMEPREIARLEAPLTVDNMEALSVTREGGRTIVWIASDNNFFPLQRTLLLKFALAE